MIMINEVMIQIEVCQTGYMSRISYSGHGAVSQKTAGISVDQKIESSDIMSPFGCN